jgi:HSP20 family protein
MNLIRRNPSALPSWRPRGMDDQFGRLVEHMFDDMLSPFTQTGMLAPDGTASPRLHISETDKAFEVQAELPGVNKDDIKVAIERQRVTIEAESKREQEEREGENLLYTERSASRYMRSFVLPVEVDEGTAQARMENGVLTLTLPKKQGSEATRIAIQ